MVHSVTVSPLTDVAVLLDDFGRILLLDLNNLIIRRMWKGNCVNIILCKHE